MGETFTLPRLASQPTTGVFARVGDSSRRRPVAQASYALKPSSSGLTFRSAQHRSGSRSWSRGPYSASCSATVCRGVRVMTLTSITAATASRVPSVSGKW